MQELESFTDYIQRRLGSDDSKLPKWIRFTREDPTSLCVSGGFHKEAKHDLPNVALVRSAYYQSLVGEISYISTRSQGTKLLLYVTKCSDDHGIFCVSFQFHYDQEKGVNKGNVLQTLRELIYSTTGMESVAEYPNETRCDVVTMTFPFPETSVETMLKCVQNTMECSCAPVMLFCVLWGTKGNNDVFICVYPRNDQRVMISDPTRQLSTEKEYRIDVINRLDMSDSLLSSTERIDRDNIDAEFVIVCYIPFDDHRRLCLRRITRSLSSSILEYRKDRPIRQCYALNLVMKAYAIDKCYSIRVECRLFKPEAVSTKEEVSPQKQQQLVPTKDRVQGRKFRDLLVTRMSLAFPELTRLLDNPGDDKQSLFFSKEMIAPVNLGEEVDNLMSHALISLRKKEDRSIYVAYYTHINLRASQNESVKYYSVDIRIVLSCVLFLGGAQIVS